MNYLPDDLYAKIERSLPIACVDFVVVRQEDSRVKVGLIRRDSPFGEVWCHLGGRILRGEAIGQALRRHARDTLDVALALATDPQPTYVHQWFPHAIAPDDATPYGSDPHKHAIGLSFIVEHEGEPAPRGEALDFGFFPLDDLPSPLWPGSETLLGRLFAHTAS